MAVCMVSLTRSTYILTVTLFTLLEAGRAQSVKRRAKGQTVGVRFPAEASFSLLHSIQTGSGASPAFDPMGNVSLSPGVKWQGREADHSSPSYHRGQEWYSYIFTPPYVFMP
jgi:hypothetical protein